ncbi:MAG: ribosome small subunit-dependent GTPase A [Armatimonadetes bacterium]|nr:ribosome small subunit-dependent GTPase A [Armatimonadota bacterium]
MKRHRLEACATSITLSGGPLPSRVCALTRHRNTTLKRKKQPYHTAQLGHLDGNERLKLLKEASKIRKLAVAKGGRRTSLGDILVEIVHAPTNAALPTVTGLVIWVGPKTATFQAFPDPLPQTLNPKPLPLSADLNGHRLAVGDLAHIADFGGNLKVVGLEPRRTKLARPDVANPHLERVIVANVDTVCIVVSVASPPLHPRLIDRYLIAIQHGGADPLLIVNKVDLLSGEELESELEKAVPYAALDVPIYACSTQSGEGLDALRGALAGRTCAFVGHSGVGKSSLVNALFPDLKAKVGDLMSGYGRGAHTTSTSSLFEVGGGTRLIDTPGIRSFGLGKMSLAELLICFPEFEAYRCKFRDCTHHHEPGCGVKAALASGAGSGERYQTYLRLLGEVCS